jgi:hypothetical protein
LIAAQTLASFFSRSAGRRLNTSVMRVSEDVEPRPTNESIRNRARCIKLVLHHDHCWHRHADANAQELIEFSLLLRHFDEIFVAILLFRSTSYYDIVNVAPSFKAASHTPDWEQRKCFPVFICKMSTCFFVFASGNMNRPGDASIVCVSHLIWLDCVVEIFAWLGPITGRRMGRGVICRHVGRR